MNNQNTSNSNSTNELEGRIETIEENLKGFSDGVKLIHFYDKHFDSHAYREALKSEVIDKATEPIDKKYRTWIGVITTILALGGFSVINYVVQDKVETRIEEKMPELAAAGEKNQSDYLMALLELRELNQKSGQEAGWINNQLDSRKDFSSVLKNFILKPDNNILEQRKYAIAYAGDTQNSDLLEPLFAILNNDVDNGFLASSEDKYLALQAILKYPNQGRNLNRVLEELEREDHDSSQDSDLIKVFALADISSDDTNTSSRLSMFMAEALNDQETLGNPADLYNSTSLFFLRHPKQWKGIKLPGELAALDGSLIANVNTLNQLIEMKSLEGGLSMTIPDANQILDSKIQGKLLEGMNDAFSTPLSENFTLSESVIRELYKELALISLKAGKPELFHEIPDYYSYSDWCNRVIPLFPDFKKTVYCEAGSNEFEEQGNEGRLSQVQDELRSESLFGYSWIEQEKKYKSVENISLEQLKGGSSLTDYIQYMSSSYYDEKIWEEEILLLFPDALAPENLVFVSAEESANYSPSNPPPGNDLNQDDLWYWVDMNQENLEWNGVNSKWELNHPSNQDG